MYTKEQLKEKKPKELKEIAKELDLKIRGNMSVDRLIDKILEGQSEAPDPAIGVPVTTDEPCIDEPCSDEPEPETDCPDNDCSDEADGTTADERRLKELDPLIKAAELELQALKDERRDLHIKIEKTREPMPLWKLNQLSRQENSRIRKSVSSRDLQNVAQAVNRRTQNRAAFVDYAKGKLGK
jgi:hypothetical protein